METYKLTLNQALCLRMCSISVTFHGSMQLNPTTATNPDGQKSTITVALQSPILGKPAT